jgi:hypothetical protein
VAANGPTGVFRIGSNAFVADGASVIANTVILGQGASVSDVLANRLLQAQGAVIRGTKGTPDLPLQEPCCPIPAFTCGGQSILVPSGASAGPLAPDTYGALVIEDDGDVTLQPGTFQFCSIDAGKRVTIRTTGATQSTINIKGDLRLSNGSSFGPDPGTPTPVVNVEGSMVRLAQGATLQAFLSAPNGVLRLGRRSVIRGTACVRRVASDKGCNVECPPFSPSGAFLDADDGF